MVTDGMPCGCRAGPVSVALWELSVKKPDGRRFVLEREREREREREKEPRLCTYSLLDALLMGSNREK